MTQNGYSHVYTTLGYSLYALYQLMSCPLTASPCCVCTVGGPAGLWHRQLWREKRVRPGPGAALRLRAPQQQRYEDRSNLRVSAHTDPSHGCSNPPDSDHNLQLRCVTRPGVEIKLFYSPNASNFCICRVIYEDHSPLWRVI